jgi:trk system potassium uptake protein TrkA
MKVVIAGAGSVGVAITEDLDAKGYHVTLLERDQELAEKLRSNSRLNIVLCDACEVSSLDAAGVADADVVVAATGDDEDNLVISLLAKQEFAVPRVIARVNNSKNQWLFNQSWGVDVSVSTPQQLTALVEEAVSVGSMVQLLRLDGSGASLVEVTLASDSPALNMAIRELAIPREATVVAIIREGHLIVPHGDTVLSAGDEVMCLVTPEASDQIQALLV